MAEKISGVYKIINTVTGDFYIGSSNNVKRRWTEHKCQSTWNKCPNNQLYQDMRKYGLDKFVFEIRAEVEIDKLKETEQQFIEKLKPSYNNYNANGLDVDRKKEYQKEYQKTDKGKESRKEAQKKYQKSDKGKEAQNKYNKSDKGKEAQKKYQKSDKGKEAQKKYNNQLCCYNGETLTLNALRKRFKRRGIDHPTQEAKKYLVH